MTTPARDRDVVTWLGLAVVGVAAAVWSFAALADLARLSGVTGTVTLFGWTIHLAWLMPLAVDVFAAVSTRVWLQRLAAPEAVKAAQWTAWAAIFTTIAGNAYHGALTHPRDGVPWIAAVIVSAVPAVALGRLVHVAVLVGRDVGGMQLDQADLRAAAEAAGVPVHVDTPVTTVYRFYSAGGDLLYVGVTDDPPSRFATHRRTQPWWPEVDRTVVRTYPRRDQALAVEQHIIDADSPRYNRQPGALRDAVSAAAERAAEAVEQAGDALGGPEPDQPDQRSVDGTASDEVLVADLRAWIDETGALPGRDRVVTAYGVGSTRAQRLRTLAAVAEQPSVPPSGLSVVPSEEEAAG